MNPRIGLDRSQTRVLPRSGTAARSAPRAGGVASTQACLCSRVRAQAIGREYVPSVLRRNSNGDSITAQCDNK